MERGRALPVLIALLLLLDGASIVAVDHRVASAGRPARILRSALDGLAHAASVRIVGTTSVLGARVQVDAVAGASRGGGSVAVGPGLFEVVLDGRNLYVKGTAGTWAEIGYGASAPALAGHWWRTSALAKPFDFFAELVNVRSLASLLQSASGLSDGPSTKFGGVPVIPLAAAGGRGITFFVTATRDPALVGANEATESMTFRDYGAAAIPPVPTGAKPLASVLPAQL